MDETNTAPGKWTLPTHGERLRSTRTGDLCSTCDVLVQKIIWPTSDPADDSDDRTFTIGWLDRLSATTYCTFCQFLVDLFRNNNDLVIEDCNEEYRILVWTSVGCENVTKSGVRAEWDLSVGFMGNEEVDTTEETRSLAQTNFPQVNFSLDVGSLGALKGLNGGGDNNGQLYHLGRVVKDEVQTEFMRKSFETCRRHHGETCERPKHVLKRGLAVEEPPDLRFLRVIDVQQKCLIALPSGGSYVALSYTWSPEPYTSCLKENIRVLEIPGGIEVDKLPPTISDSMDVVARLGERFLWADRLCIVQDDPRDKRIQINQMDTVYRYATLTIVAAGTSKGTSDPGLPGIRPGTRKISQATAEIKGLHFLETNSYLDETISKSRWHSRAWTFQEHLLSKRHLVFTPERAVFFCAKDTFAEDYIRKARLDPHNDTANYTTPSSTDDIHASGIPSIPTAYEVMIRWYTSRNLTVESDILKGISGLLQTVTRETKTRFLCGMPLTPNLIDHFLLWLPIGPSVRRGKNAFGLDFPSWSWAGWVGGAIYTISGEALDGREVVQYDEETMIEGGYKILLATQANVYAEFEPADIEDDVLVNLEWCKLSFTAQTAMVEISATVWGYFSDCEFAGWGDVSRCRQVFIEGKFAGMVLLHVDKTRVELEDLQLTPQEALQQTTATVEAIALSSTYRPWPVYFPISKYSRDSVNFYYTDKEGEEKDHLPFDTDVWDDEDPEMVNVMVIEWEDGLATRRGVGQVHSDAWKVLRAEERGIVLG
ncbi:hypothetical protein PRZ48_009505 [Zasmidium cellare]|uniref:Heterokaryon incompatibility domain-containing protein n=1 Tax=Zasmidium cellare TaxID=395010 RepID=A0ABR0EBW7_ZASCE|nr:hypothetical protein PRZ48_009505 [Zasmidium cellare]